MGGQEMHWRKASESGPNGNCVEVAHCDDVYIRDSKNPDGGRLAVSRSAAAAFLADVRAGRLDLPGTG